MNLKKIVYSAVATLLMHSQTYCHGLDDEPQQRGKKFVRQRDNATPYHGNLAKEKKKSRKEPAKDTNGEAWKKKAEEVTAWMDQQDDLEQDLYRQAEDQSWKIEACELSRFLERASQHPNKAMPLTSSPTNTLTTRQKEDWRGRADAATRFIDERYDGVSSSTQIPRNEE